MYVKIVNGVVNVYPYTIARFRADNPQTSFPKNMPNERLAEWGVYPVIPTTPPVPTITENLVEQTPNLVNGVWTQVWALVPASEAEIARRTAEANRATAKGDAKNDAFIKTFLAMTPAQVDAYVTNNTANLAEVRTFLRRMALILLALSKESLED